MGAVFAAAAADDLIPKNPAVGVKLPREEHNELVVPTTGQVLALLEHAPDWFKPAVIVGACLGLRQGEATGLTCDRINWAGRTVRIDRQWTRFGDFAPPKTKHSLRTFPASEWLTTNLAPFAPEAGSDRLVLRTPAGKPVAHATFNVAWRATCEAAGVDGLRYHDLRHFFASALISGGRR